VNTRFHLAAILLSLGVAVQGCMVKPETVHFAPQLDVHQTDIGQGKVLGLDVADVRADKKAGIVGDPKMKFITVMAEDDSPSAIYKQAEVALTKLDFKVQPASESTERALRLEVRELQYESIKQLFTFDNKSKVLLGAIARSGGDRYDRTYETEETSTTGAPPGQSEISKTINRLLSASLNDVLADRQLMGILAK
jgi:uncharacterized lipoprotein YajG